MKSNRLTMTLSALALALVLAGCGADAVPTGVNTPPDNSPPAAPVQLTLERASGADQLTWSPSASASVTGYQVYVYAPTPTSENAYILLGTTDAGTTAYALPAVSAPCMQYYRVRAVDGAGNRSALSGMLEARLTPTTSEGTPGIREPGRPHQD